MGGERLFNNQCHCEERSNREQCNTAFLRAIALFLAMTFLLFLIVILRCYSE
jgi:hypothetical protein